MATITAVPSFASRRGNRMFVPRSAPLPPNCIKCGAPANTPWRKKFYWHHPALYLMILFPGLLIYAVVALIVRKQMELNVPLCETHHADRKRYMLLGSLMLIGFLPAGLLLGIVFSEALGWVTGSVMCVIGLIFFVMTGLGFAPTRIGEHGAVFKGAGLAFLNLLPEDHTNA